jgi:hypothetical protein
MIKPTESGGWGNGPEKSDTPLRFVVSIRVFTMNSIMFVCFMFLLTIAGCGGSNDNDGIKNRERIVPTVTTAASVTTIAGKQITVSSEQYLNLMPQVIDDGHLSSCDNLIIPAYLNINSQPFPDGLTVESVSLLQNNEEIWSGAIINSETRFLADGGLFIISRGCSPQGLEGGANTEVVLTISCQSSLYYLRAPAVALGAVY